MRMPARISDPRSFGEHSLGEIRKKATLHHCVVGDAPEVESA